MQSDLRERFRKDLESGLDADFVRDHILPAFDRLGDSPDSGAREALTDALDGLEEMIGYVPEYFRNKWSHQDYIDRAKAALARLGEKKDGPPVEAPGDSLRESEESGLCGCGRRLGDGARVVARAEVGKGGTYHESEARTCYRCAEEIQNRLATMDSLRLFLLAPKASSSTPRSREAAEGSKSDPFPILTEDGYCRKAPPPTPSRHCAAPDCGTLMIHAPGIGDYCPNKACGNLDGPAKEDAPPAPSLVEALDRHLSTLSTLTWSDSGPEREIARGFLEPFVRALSTLPVPQGCCKGLAPKSECFVSCGGSKPDPVPQAAGRECWVGYADSDPAYPLAVTGNKPRPGLSLNWVRMVESPAPEAGAPNHIADWARVQSYSGEAEYLLGDHKAKWLVTMIRSIATHNVRRLIAEGEAAPEGGWCKVCGAVRWPSLTKQGLWRCCCRGVFHIPSPAPEKGSAEA